MRWVDVLLFHRSPRTSNYTPWLPIQTSPQGNPTYKTLSPTNTNQYTMSPPTNTNQYPTYGAFPLANQPITSPMTNAPIYNAQPVLQPPPVQQNVHIIERIIEKPVEKIVYVDRYIHSPPPPSPPPSFVMPSYHEAPILLQQDMQVRMPHAAAIDDNFLLRAI